MNRISPIPMGKINDGGIYTFQNHSAPAIISGTCICSACASKDREPNLLKSVDNNVADISSSSFSSLYLISEAFSNHTKNIVDSAAGETLYYYLESESATVNLANGRVLDT